MCRRRAATWAFWICGLSVLVVSHPVRADEAISGGLQLAQSQLVELEAASSALDSAGRGKADTREPSDTTVLEAHRKLLDLEIKQQKELAAREKDLQEARGQMASLKADLEKLQAAAKQRDGELAQRESLEAKGKEELASLRSQIEKLEASIAAERKGREEALAEAKRLQAERQKLESEQSQRTHPRETASAERSNEKEGEQMSSLRAQVEKLEASIADERKERQKAQDEVNRLVAEREKLQAQLGQLVRAPEQTANENEAGSPQGAGDGVARIKKWQKADGSLFFGERPPPGSKLLGEVENLGTSGGGENQGSSQ